MHEIERAQLVGGALALGIEAADRFQRVAEEIEPHRLGHARREEETDGTAAHGVFARLAHGRGAREAVELEPLGDAVHGEHLAGHDRERLPGDEVPCRHALERGIDRVSPHAGFVAQRMIALSRLIRVEGRDRPSVLLTTVNAALQRVPARDFVARQSLSVVPGQMLAMDGITQWLELNGFVRASTVREAGEYAVRGGIIDLFAPGMAEPVRLDFFGNTLETIRSFDPESQRTTDQLRALDLVPVAEFQLTTETIRRFRLGYVEAFGAPTPDDLLYHAVSEGRRHPGMEHWLPLFHEKLDTLFDYAPGSPVVLEPLAEDAARERLGQIEDYYDARQLALTQRGSGPPYQPLPPDRLYLGEAEWRERLEAAALVRLTPFAVPEGQGPLIDAGDQAGAQFRRRARRARPQRVRGGDRARRGAAGVRQARRRSRCGAKARASACAMCSPTTGSPISTSVESWPQALALPRPQVALAVLGLESGFETARSRGGRRAGHSGRPAGAAAPRRTPAGELHRRGRQASPPAISSSMSITASAASSGCARSKPPARRTIVSKSTTPAATSCSCRSRTSSCSRATARRKAHVELDRLGGGAWQARKARMKRRIREIANELIKIAAERQLREAPRLAVGHGLYDEFCAGFPYEETEDQQAAIDTVLAELGSGRPMDRLICGDVGFGKTEVALRAAFVAAMNGKQVAVVVPTTLLARQHTKTFSERFRGFPVHIAQASRLIPSSELARVKKKIADGGVDIVIGTHALLGKAIKFQDLGLLIVDEEQHFGVAHKERLKQLRAEVHVITLTATPIPRTLQLALSGVRDLSIIASPPVDRLAVRTFVAPFDPVIVREALLRERYRGGQAFYVCPRIEDLAGAKDFLDKHVPEMRVAVAHGQMPSTVLEDIMSAFYDGKYDVLLSTTIIESGLDIPTANTLIVHRADRFGLSQLYQLRGRVGRSKLRAYSLFTLPAVGKITPQAERRLKVLQSLDTLGAGFQLASHDLDIRGAGNLLGEEQSGHIKEVGFELYQQMLEEAVTSLKAGITAPVADKWSPQITIGTPVHDSRGLCRRPAGAARALPPPGRDRGRARDRGVRRRAGRSFRAVAGRGRASSPDRRDQVALPAGQCGEDRGRAEGRGAFVPRQHLRQSRPARRLHPRPGSGGAGAARHEGRLLRRLGRSRGAPARDRGHPAQPGGAGAAGQGGVKSVA